jgi:hypothetical protein
MFSANQHVTQQLTLHQTIVKSSQPFQIPKFNPIFAPNLEGHFHAKNKKYSDHRTR